MPGPKIKQETYDKFIKLLANAECQFLRFEKTHVYYICHCGKETKHLKQGVERPNFRGCKDCTGTRRASQATRIKVTQALQKQNGLLIRIGKGRKVVYQCSCGEEATSKVQNILKESWKGCIKCANEKRGSKNTIEEVIEIFKEGGEILPIQEYKGNKVKLKYTCSFCGKEAHVSLSEFRRGRRCEHCCKDRAKITNLKKYGAENPFQSTVCKEKMKETCVKKYGVSHHRQLKEIQEKAEKTCIERYGLRFAFHSDDSKAKAQETCIEKYGVSFPLQSLQIHRKIKKRFVEILGVEYPFSSKEFMANIMGNPEIRDRRLKTIRERFGVDNVMQNPEVFAKAMASAFSLKMFCFPSGRIEVCQGYEPECFYDLLIEIEDEDDLEVGWSNDNPEIWYNNPETGNRSKYYPDGFIRSKKTVIEVKSLHTYKIAEEKNEAKFKRVAEMGYKLDLRIYGKKNGRGKVKLLEKRVYHPVES